MAYQILLRGSFARDVKGYKKEKNLKDRIQVAVESICNNPNIGEPLVGNWFGVQKYAFHESPKCEFYMRCTLPAAQNGQKKMGNVMLLSPIAAALSSLFLQRREKSAIICMR